MKRKLETAGLLLLAGLLAASGGCVWKSIGVRSDPPGALVLIDGKEVGRTPLEGVPFYFYGTREITLIKKGYRTERRTVEISAPWYTWFPLDIFTELLLPVNLHDRRRFYFPLRRMEPMETATLRRRAEETREIARARIDGARRVSSYRPRKYVVEGKKKRFFLFGLFESPPRTPPEKLRVRPKSE